MGAATVRAVGMGLLCTLVAACAAGNGGHPGTPALLPHAATAATTPSAAPVEAADPERTGCGNSALCPFGPARRDIAVEVTLDMLTLRGVSVGSFYALLRPGEIRDGRLAGGSRGTRSAPYTIALSGDGGTLYLCSYQPIRTADMALDGNPWCTRTTLGLSLQRRFGTPIRLSGGDVLAAGAAALVPPPPSG